MGMLSIFERGAEQDAVALIPMEDGSVETAEVPTEVRDRLSELHDAREAVIMDLLQEYHGAGHPTAEGTLTRLNRRLYDLNAAQTDLRLAKLDAEEALAEQVRQLRAQRAATERAQLEPRASMPRWRQMAASILTLMTAHL